MNERKENKRKDKIKRLESQIKHTEGFKRRVIRDLQLELEETKRNRVL